jgi:hypothetical protein
MSWHGNPSFEVRSLATASRGDEDTPIREEWPGVRLAARRSGAFAGWAMMAFAMPTAGADRLAAFGRWPAPIRHGWRYHVERGGDRGELLPAL